MHYYGREVRLEGSGGELKLDPNAQRVRGRSLAELRPAFQKVEDLMRVLGFPGVDLVAVRVALHEAATNAVRHGNRGNPSKLVEVRYLVTHDEVVVEVEDEGPGFDPSRVADPFLGGDVARFKQLGLFMMRAHMNWVRFNSRGNQVTLGRRRSAAQRGETAGGCSHEVNRGPGQEGV